MDEISNTTSRVYGLTGWAGSGKSLVARFLMNKGAAWLDADAEARNVFAPDAPALQQLYDALGPKTTAMVRCEDGSLDRRALRDLLSEDPTVRATVEGLSHPMIIANLLNRIREAAETHPVVIVEAALLMGSGMEKLMDGVIVVTAPGTDCAQRVATRDDVPLKQAKALLSLQIPQDTLAAAADCVIENTGSIEDLQQHIDGLWPSLVRADHLNPCTPGQ